MKPIKFFLRIEPEPPRVTHQQQKVAVKNGKVVKYEDARLKKARALFMSLLKPYAPEKPWEDVPILMETKWIFRKAKNAKGDYMIKRPDCDNLQKLLQDCMSACGFWKDDSQVMPFIQKLQSEDDDIHGIYISLSLIDYVVDLDTNNLYM